MMKRIVIIAILVMILTIACSRNDNNPVAPVKTGDFTLKSYALERNPKINRAGAGLDFIHDESVPDTVYLGGEVPAEFVADAVFYNLMVYYTDNNGDTQSEGCPAILLSNAVSAVQVGVGISYFNNLTTITAEMTGNLAADNTVDLNLCKNGDDLYDRDLVMSAFDSCVIGNKFRGREVEIPRGGTEQDVQPVFLIHTIEGGYIKFMVTQFKGDGADKQKTLVQWQLLKM